MTLMAINLPEKPVLELDSSWRQALAYFFHRGYPFGESVVFTYGPLGFLMGNTFTGLYFWAYVVYQIVFSVIAATMIFRVGRPLTGLARFAYYGFFLLWGFSYPDALHMIVIAYTGWIMINRISAGESPRPAAFGLFLAFLAVIKFTNLLFAGFVVVIVTAYAVLKPDRKSAGWLFGSFAVGFLGIWVACGQSLSSLHPYVINSLSVSDGYQAAMGLRTPDGQLTTALLVFAAGTLYVIWHFVTQPNLIRSLAQMLILGAFLFLNWKHGFVRSDGHMIGFFYCALVPAVAFPVLFREQTANPFIPRACLLLVMLFCFKGMHATFHTTIEYAPNVANDDMMKTVRAFADFDDYRSDLQGQVDARHREDILRRIKPIVGDASIDVLGFEQAIALFNDFNYTPRPVFQSYSVYTPRLAQLNADFITSDRAPEFFLLKLQVIDERPLMMDDSQLMNFFPHLYTFRAMEKGFYLFQKRTEHPPIDSLRPRLLRNLDQPLGEPLSLASYGAEGIWLEIDLPFSLLGRARNFLYKPPFVQLRVITSFGEDFTYRLPLTSARAGFQISPHITDFDSYLEAHGGGNPRKVESITVLVDDEDRRFFAEAAAVKLSHVPKTDTNREYHRQLDRDGFNIFARQPVDFQAATSLSNIEIDGREAVILHAPSFMTFNFEAGIHRISGAIGYPENAYRNGGETDGAAFFITWTDGTERRELFRRELDPFQNEGDRGLQPFSIDTSGLPSGQVIFETSIRSHPGWDWSAWADIKFE